MIIRIISWNVKGFNDTADRAVIEGAMKKWGGEEKPKWRTWLITLVKDYGDSGMLAGMQSPCGRKCKRHPGDLGAASLVSLKSLEVLFCQDRELLLEDFDKVRQRCNLWLIVGGDFSMVLIPSKRSCELSSGGCSQQFLDIYLQIKTNWSSGNGQ